MAATVRRARQGESAGTAGTRRAETVELEVQQEIAVIRQVVRSAGDEVAMAVTGLVAKAAMAEKAEPPQETRKLMRYADWQVPAVLEVQVVSALAETGEMAARLERDAPPSRLEAIEVLLEPEPVVTLEAVVLEAARVALMVRLVVRAEVPMGLRAQLALREKHAVEAVE